MYQHLADWVERWAGRERVGKELSAKEGKSDSLLWQLSATLWPKLR